MEIAHNIANHLIGLEMLSASVALLLTQIQQVLYIRPK
jgi:hypothetical protein